MSTYRDNIRAADLRQIDLEQTCPHCFDYSPSTAVFCQSCGTSLTAQRPRIVIPPDLAPEEAREGLRGQTHGSGVYPAPAPASPRAGGANG